MLSRLRVLHVTQAVGGGVARHIVDIARHVPGAAHHAVLPSPWESAGPSGAPYDTSAVSALRIEGVRVQHLEFARTSFNRSNLANTARLHALIKNMQPHIVHAHSTIGGAAGRLAAINTEVPVIYTPNGIFAGSFVRTAERLLGPLTSRLVAVSPSEAREALRLGLCDPKRVVIVPNGIDLDAPLGGRDIRSRLGLAPATPLVGTVMRLISQKAPEHFVRVAIEVSMSHPGVHFVLIGMGPLQSRVDAEVARAGLEGRFHQIPHLDNAGSVLNQFDVFVLPSRFEGAPYAPLEAMRAGTPVVLSDVVGNTDVVEPGVSGMLVPFGDYGGMAAAVLKLLHDPEGSEQISNAARVRLRERFDVRLMGEAIGELYEEVAFEGRRRNTLRLPQFKGATSIHSSDSKAAL